MKKEARTMMKVHMHMPVEWYILLLSRVNVDHAVNFVERASEEKCQFDLRFHTKHMNSVYNENTHVSLCVAHVNLLIKLL